MKDQLSKTEINHYTNLWCKQQGFKVRDLENSKTAEYTVLLVTVRQDYWRFMDSHSRNVWAGLNSVVQQGYPLKDKHLTKIEKIIDQATKAQIRYQANLEKIKKLRQQPLDI